MSTLVKDLLKNYYNLDDTTHLDLSRAIDCLIDNGSFTDDEVIILKLTTDGVSAKEISSYLQVSVNLVNTKLSKLSDKISEFLGEEYSDNKILKSVENKLGKPLTDKEKEFCIKTIRMGHQIKKGVNIFNFDECGEDN